MVALQQPDATGHRFGRLTITGEVPTRGNGRLVSCTCECGRQVVKLRHSVVGGRTRSCGCLQKETARTARLGTGKTPLLPVPVATEECECGNAKAISDEACDRCRWLDGEGAPQQALVSAMLVLGELATLPALMAEMCCTERTVYRALAVLRAQGRVDALAPDGADNLHPERFRYVPAANDPGRTGNMMHDAACRGGYYVYEPKRPRKPIGGDGAPALYVLKNTRRG